MCVWAVALMGGALTAALAPRLSPSALVALILVIAATAGLMAASGGAGSSGPALVGGLICALFIGAVVLTCRPLAWSLRII